MSGFHVCVSVAAVLGFAAIAGAASAQPMSNGNSCQSALNALSSEWAEISFTPPSKPGQAIVRGRQGRVTTGGDYNFMTGELRQAHAECERGDVSAAMRRISALQDMLGRSVQPAG